MKQDFRLQFEGLPELWPTLRQQGLAAPAFRGTFTYQGRTYYEFGQQAHPEAPPDFDLCFTGEALLLCRYDFEEPWEGLEAWHQVLEQRLGLLPAWQAT